MISPAPAQAAGLARVDRKRQEAASIGPLQGRQIDRYSMDIVDEWGTQSFPASDPPANW
jgi:hypothetical protein